MGGPLLRAAWPAQLLQMLGWVGGGVGRSGGHDEPGRTPRLLGRKKWPLSGDCLPPKRVGLHTSVQKKGNYNYSKGSNMEKQKVGNFQ